MFKAIKVLKHLLNVHKMQLVSLEFAPCDFVSQCVLFSSQLLYLQYLSVNTTM